MSFTHIRIKVMNRDKLMRLRGVVNVRSVDAVIEELMHWRGYTEDFFRRLDNLPKQDVVVEEE